MTPIFPVIMCGGSGTRLWPLSRRLEPKQFQKLVSESSLFQDTLARFGTPQFGRPTVLVNAAQEPRVQLELAQAGQDDARIVVEPAIRSTAPAIAAAACVIAEDDPDAILLVVPSDHQIGRPDRLLDAHLAALEFVQNGGIALFGIMPTAPETGFGYIRASADTVHGVARVEAFVEKPNIEVATQMIADPRYTWNSGIFMFKAATILQELERFAPAVLQAVKASIDAARRDGSSVHLSGLYSDAPEISIDHAVMEHSSALGVVPVSPEWNDVGSFEALWDVSERNAEENFVLGDVILRDVRRSYIRGGRRLVSIVGLSNVVVVDTDDALLVASRAQSQDVKFIAQHLAKIGHRAADQHLVQQQAGGQSRLIETSDVYRVDHVTVASGGQMTFDMAEGPSSCSLTALTGDVILACNGNTIRIAAGATHSCRPIGRLILASDGAEAVQILMTTITQASLARDDADERKVS